jgi:hypothetical protein
MFKKDDIILMEITFKNQNVTYQTMSDKVENSSLFWRPRVDKSGPQWEEHFSL